MTYGGLWWKVSLTPAGTVTLTAPTKRKLLFTVSGCPFQAASVKGTFPTTGELIATATAKLTLQKRLLAARLRRSSKRPFLSTYPKWAARRRTDRADLHRSALGRLGKPSVSLSHCSCNTHPPCVRQSSVMRCQESLAAANLRHAGAHRRALRRPVKVDAQTICT